MEPKIKLLDEFIPDVNPDCLKVCPMAHNILALGHYKQIEGENVVGRLSVIDISLDKHRRLCQLEVSPILHVTWVSVPINNCYLLVAACRDSSVKILNYDPMHPSLTLVKDINISPAAYCLYCDCVVLQDTLQIVYCTDKSAVYKCQVDLADLSTLNCQQLQGHSYAVWTCRISLFAPHLVASGDQIDTLNIYDPRASNKLVMKNKKSHPGGISDIVWSGRNQHILITGGFDGGLRFFDTRKIVQPFDDTYKTQGVLWRVNWDEQQGQMLISVSSQNYFEVLNCAESMNYRAQSVSQIKGKHQSLAYACDWNREKIVTASFYDRLVCIWTRE